MKRFTYLILAFSILFLFFFIGLVFLRVPFSPYPLISLQDVVDILTPLVLIPLYLLLYRIGSKTPFSTAGLIIFVVFAAFWASGQGMHLAANSINNFLGHQKLQAVDIYTLTNFYDETLSHYIWYIGIFGLSALLIFRQWKNPFTGKAAPLWPVIAAGIIHGISLFLITMEGNTWLLGIPFAALVFLFMILKARQQVDQKPLVLFFLISGGLVILIFVVWLSLFGWPPPEPMEALKL